MSRCYGSGVLWPIAWSGRPPARSGPKASPKRWAGCRTAAADLAEADESLRCIARYEARFRADGVLAPEGRIDTLSAFDHGRAVNVVRMALGARYCDPQQAEQAVLRIGELARRTYSSWEEFPLGYALTRLILFDGEVRAEEKYAESLAQHRILTQDPTSPYRNIPWS